MVDFTGGVGKIFDIQVGKGRGNYTYNTPTEKNSEQLLIIDNIYILHYLFRKKCIWTDFLQFFLQFVNYLFRFFWGGGENNKL